MNIMSIISIISAISTIVIIFINIMNQIKPNFIKRIIYYKIYKKSDQLKEKFNSREFLMVEIPSEFNISFNDLWKMQELKLCKVLPFSNLRNKYKMVDIDEIIR